MFNDVKFPEPKYSAAVLVPGEPSVDPAEVEIPPNTMHNAQVPDRECTSPLAVSDSESSATWSNVDSISDFASIDGDVEDNDTSVIDYSEVDPRRAAHLSGTENVMEGMYFCMRCAVTNTVPIKTILQWNPAVMLSMIVITRGPRHWRAGRTNVPQPHCRSQLRQTDRRTL